MTVCFPPLIKPDTGGFPASGFPSSFVGKRHLKLRFPIQGDLQLPDFIGCW